MSVEDGQLLRNAFGWLALFDATSERRLRSLAGLCGQSKGPEDSIFTLEYLVTQYLVAVRDGNQVLESDYLTSLKSHPLWNASDLVFNQLVQGVMGKKGVPPQLEGVVLRIKDLVSPTRAPKKKGILVDEALGQIVQAKSGRKIISLPLARALSLLKAQQTISNEEFIQACFGLHTYDPSIHNGKIFNLLTRLKALTGDDLNYRMKQGYIYAEGTWRSVHFVTRSTPPKVVTPPPSRSVEEVRSVKARNILPAWNGLISRLEIESRIGRPRSSTNRLITRWIGEGRIRKEGNSKSTRYAYLGRSENHGVTQ